MGNVRYCREGRSHHRSQQRTWREHCEASCATRSEGRPGARRKDRIDAVVNEISAAGGKAVGFTVDVTKRVEVEALIKGAVESFGPRRRLGE